MGFLQGYLEEGLPLAEDSVMVLSPGLLTGVGVPFGSRLHISGRSPLTGLLGSSNVGGHAGVALRRAGIRSLLIESQASQPSYLLVSPSGSRVEPCPHLWGLGTRETSRILRERLGSGARVLTIGPAGEKRARFACIMTETGHAAGRTGMGAVMGAKKLKAIVIMMDGPSPRLSSAQKELSADYSRRVRQSQRFETYSRYSNSAYVEWASDMGILATRNFRDTQFEGASQIDGKALFRYVTHPRACHGCPVHCKAEVRYDYGEQTGLTGERPDIEPIVNLGSKCGLADPQGILHLHNLAGDLGLDSISTGAVLAFALDLFDRGIIGPTDTDGLDLRWGDASVMEELMLKIARQEGFGRVLGLGVREAAEVIGRGAREFAYHSKGLELPAYDPRGAKGTALGYAVSTRGADFTSVYTTPEFRLTPQEGKENYGDPASVDRLSERGKGALVKKSMIISAVLDSLGICKVPILSILGDYSLEQEAGLVRCLTGLDMNPSDLLEVGERVLGEEHQFNLRFGAREGDDRIPQWFSQNPVQMGPSRGHSVEVSGMVREFRRLMRWDYPAVSQEDHSPPGEVSGPPGET